LEKHYRESDIKEKIIEALNKIFYTKNIEPLYICIGSDRHILDCYGPLVGTMLEERAAGLLVYGTLDQPLHAKNMVKEIAKIKANHPETIDVAIDASVGNEKDLGIIRIKRGFLIPGKATAKRLPPVGQVSITGTVGLRFDKRGSKSSNSGSITSVYHMAKCTSEAIDQWNKNRVRQ
jgi:putative sporulation protein YyaC